MEKENRKKLISCTKISPRRSVRGKTRFYSCIRKKKHKGESYDPPIGPPGITFSKNRRYKAVTRCAKKLIKLKK